jgi:hypothetical protein
MYLRTVLTGGEYLSVKGMNIWSVEGFKIKNRIVCNIRQRRAEYVKRTMKQRNSQSSHILE